MFDIHDFKYFCREISVIVIISGVLLSFVPESKLKKSYKSFVILMTIFMFITPFSKVKSVEFLNDNINFSSNLTKEDLMVNNSNLVLHCAENLLNERLNSTLAGVNITVGCESHIKEEGGKAYIEKVDILGELSSEDKNKVISQVESVLGGGVEIDFVG